MPSWICMKGVEDAVMSNDSPDVVMRRIDEAGDGWITIDTIRLAHDDEPRTMYIRAAEITAVMPIHPRQLEAELDDPPDWYARD
jgi:hypothetical protein